MHRVHVHLLAVGMVFLVPSAASARRVRLGCVDGCFRPGAECDVDGLQDGVCTFELCPYRCKGRSPCIKCPVPVAVPVGKSVMKTPGMTFVLRCRRGSESASDIACSVTTTTTITTTTTLASSPSHLSAFLPDAPGTPFFTLSVMGCQVEFPLLNVTVIAGTFTCEPSVNCPAENGFARVSASEIAGFSAEADFVNAGTRCTFSFGELEDLFTCRDGAGNLVVRGSWGFALGQHPPCPPGTLVP